MSKKTPIEIRNVRPEDVETVFDQVSKLAKLQNLSHILCITPDFLLKELFKPEADWFCFVAVSGEEVIGHCLYSFININRPFNPTPALYIDILFVSESHRKLGVAGSLMKEVAQIALKNKISRIELWCAKANNVAQSFYKSIQATKIDMIDVMSFDVEKLL